MSSNMARLVVLIVLELLVPRGGDAWTGREEGPGTAPQYLDSWGFSIAEPQQLGEQLEMVAVLTPHTEMPIPFYFSFVEYTVHMHGMTLVDQYPDGLLIVSVFDGGYADFYQDTSFNAPFHYWSSTTSIPAMDPGVVPGNFTDGNLFLRMDFLSLVTLYYPASGIGAIAYSDTELRATGGSQLEKLDNAHMIVGWHMGGGYTDEPSAIPPGYELRYDTLIRWENPLPVEPTTWGSIKGAFRN
jgi:hypothetical protein